MQVCDHVVTGLGEGQTWVVGSAVSKRMSYASLSCARWSVLCTGRASRDKAVTGVLVVHEAKGSS